MLLSFNLDVDECRIPSLIIIYKFSAQFNYVSRKVDSVVSGYNVTVCRAKSELCLQLLEFR